MVFICLISLFIYKLDNVKTDKGIKEKAIEELRTKKYLSFLDDHKTTVSTDISFKKNGTDTVYWQCTISECGNLKLMQKINFHFGDGFSVININVIKLSSKYKTFIEHYSDYNSKNSKKYYIKNQNLILDKKTYKKGDSIFGKIDLIIKEENNSEINFSKLKGYFKGKID